MIRDSSINEDWCDIFYLRIIIKSDMKSLAQHSTAQHSTHGLKKCKKKIICGLFKLAVSISMSTLFKSSTISTLILLFVFTY